MANEKISALPAATNVSATDLLPSTQNYTTVGTGTTRKVTAALLAQGVVGAFNVRAFGATGDGTTDDTSAFQSTAAAIATAGGGMMMIPPGAYLLSAAVPLAAKTLVLAAGKASRIIVAAGFVDPGDGKYSIFYNENWTASAITDANITISDVFFDDSANPSHGSFHTIRLRMARDCVVVRCQFLYGGDAVAIRACDNVTVQECYGELCKNCFWDAWEASTNISYLHNVSVGNDAAQHANFNAVSNELTSNMHAQGFKCIGNVFRDAVGSSCQFEPLGSDGTNTVKNCIIAENTFDRVNLVMRGATSASIVSANLFLNQGTGSAITAVTLFGSSPHDLLIDGNTFVNPGNTTGFGVIRLEAASSVITNNTITGNTYGSNAGIYTGSVLSVLVASNYVSNGVVTAPRSIAQSTEWHVPNGIRWGTYDNAGFRVDMRVQSGDNNLIFQGVGAGGAARVIFSQIQGSDTSNLVIPVGVRFSDYIRISANTELTATGTTQAGALALVKNFNNVTTTPANSGVILQAGTTVPNNGYRVTVWNNGANALKVYPPVSAQIDGLGLNVPVVLAVGQRQTWVAFSSTLYLTETAASGTINGIALSATGVTQGTAAPILTPTVYVTAIAGVNDGVILPVGTAGQVIQVLPDSAADDVKLYPPTSGAINQGAVNAAVTIASTRGVVTVVCYSAGFWATTQLT